MCAFASRTQHAILVFYNLSLHTAGMTMECIDNGGRRRWACHKGIVLGEKRFVAYLCVLVPDISHAEFLALWSSQIGHAYRATNKQTPVNMYKVDSWVSGFCMGR